MGIGQLRYTKANPSELIVVKKNYRDYLTAIQEYAGHLAHGAVKAQRQQLPLGRGCLVTGQDRLFSYKDLRKQQRLRLRCGFSAMSLGSPNLNGIAKEPFHLTSIHINHCTFAQVASGSRNPMRVTVIPACQLYRCRTKSQRGLFVRVEEARVFHGRPLRRC